MKKTAFKILIGLLCFGGNGLYASFHGIPTARIQDEFSYLLAADTFAHGRLTNPTHPFWEHFETFQVLQQPSYMSKYPPAQGMFMAVGQVLWGHPIYGVWLSASLMCMAITWMLFAWIPPGWALTGGLIAVLQFGVFTYWSQSYWGGAVAALGGAVVFGALPRIFKYRRVRDVLWLGLGVALLANSRPLDGLLVGIPLGCFLLPWKIKWNEVKGLYFIQMLVLPFFLILLLMITGMGFYNKALTAKASISPYVYYLDHQMTVPMFIWQPLKPPHAFKNRVMRDFEKGFEERYYLSKRTWKGFWSDEFNDACRIFRFYFGYLLGLALFFVLLTVFRDKRKFFKLFVVIAVLLVTCACMVAKAQAHYFSTLTCLVVLLLVSGLRVLACSLKRRSFMVIGVLLALQLVINIFVEAKVPGNLLSYGLPVEGQGIALKSYTRKQFKDLLEQKGGKHLVLVKDAPGRFFHNEWVYNGADIDRERIVWARSMSEEENARLTAYFKDRQVWRITLDKEEYQPKKYYQR